MSGDQTAQLAGAIMMLVLVGSSLVARRLPMGQVARMAAGWIAIFGALLIAFSFRTELHTVWQRVAGELLGERGQTVGTTLRVPMSEDGHFWVRASVNSVEQRFLIDSGATTTALSVAAAEAADIEMAASSFPVALETANGQVEARRATIGRLQLGPILSKDLAVVVAPAFGRMNVLGMNFLSSLRSWRVEGRTLILDPLPPKQE